MLRDSARLCVTWDYGALEIRVLRDPANDVFAVLRTCSLRVARMCYGYVTGMLSVCFRRCGRYGVTGLRYTGQGQTDKL